MAKTTEPALVQVCSVKLATSVKMGFLFVARAPFVSGKLSLRCRLCQVQWHAHNSSTVVT